jgi:hypothetical protein
MLGALRQSLESTTPFEPPAEMRDTLSGVDLVGAINISPLGVARAD